MTPEYNNIQCSKWGMVMIVVDLKFLLILSTLSILGLYSVFQQLSNLYPKNCNIYPRVILLVKNLENEIEGIVRNYYEKSGKITRELWIIDNGSDDETLKILELLTLTFPGLKILHHDGTFEDCICEISQYDKVPSFLWIDTRKLQYSEINAIINLVFMVKNTKLGLKSYSI